MPTTTTPHIKPHRSSRRLAAAIALALCLALPASGMAIPQIGDLPSTAAPSIKIGDTPVDYPGTSGGPAPVVTKATAAPVTTSAPDGFDWASAAIGAAGAIVLTLCGAALVSRNRMRTVH